MALLFFDGFESYENPADVLALKSDLINNITYTYSANISKTAGRRGGGCYYSIQNDNRFVYTLNSNFATFIFGIAMKYAEVQTPDGVFGTYSWFFADSGTNQIVIATNGSELVVYNGDSTLIGTTSGAGLSYNVWNYIEVKFTIHDSAGAIEIRVNGNTVLDLTSQDTQYSGNAYINQLGIGAARPAIDTYYDDMYWCDNTGAKNNDFLGDVRVDCIRPDAVGTYTDFTPSEATNWQGVDDVNGPDDDGSYNDGELNDKDTYNLGALGSPSGTTIHGVKSQITMKKTDAGSRSCKILTRSGSTDHQSSEFSASDSYVTPAEIIEDNPDDAAAWEDADVNAMEVGVEVSA